MADKKEVPITTATAKDSEVVKAIADSNKKHSEMMNKLAK